MSKRSVAYVKPNDPSFLAKLKQQIGYKAAPTVETKKAKLEDLSTDLEDENIPEREDEKPQIVVLKSGDLTAEEVEIEKQRLIKEASETHADLTKPIVFQKRKLKDSKSADKISSEAKSSESSNKKHCKANRSGVASKPFDRRITSRLSFNPNEEDEVDF